MAAHPRAPRPNGSRSEDQHFLRREVLADELVRQVDIRSNDVVVEIGAGTGVLTRPLARRARRVIAVERVEYVLYGRISAPTSSSPRAVCEMYTYRSIDDTSPSSTCR